jgi:integrase
MLKQLEHVATLPTIRLGMKLYLLTMVRKSELQDAVWDEVDFDNAVWTIPKERMKHRLPDLSGRPKWAIGSPKECCSWQIQQTLR